MKSHALWSQPFKFEESRNDVLSMLKGDASGLLEIENAVSTYLTIYKPPVSHETAKEVTDDLQRLHAAFTTIVEQASSRFGKHGSAMALIQGECGDDTRKVDAYLDLSDFADRCTLLVDACTKAQQRFSEIQKRGSPGLPGKAARSQLINRIARVAEVVGIEPKRNSEFSRLVELTYRAAGIKHSVDGDIKDAGITKNACFAR